MDYTGIIQLIIATIFYSTLVAPNIKKMSDLRSEISDMVFPLKTDEKKYEKAVAELGMAINKKMKQYAAVYAETRKFLWLLYAAMIIALVSQIVPPAHAWIVERQIQSEPLMGAAITLAIFILLVVAMRIFILKPERIRTFDWLSSVGIAQTYSRDIFNPSLEINQVAKNIRESNNHVNICIASDMTLYGYSLILTIEDVDGDKLYHVVAGRVEKTKYLLGSSNYYGDGKNRAILDLVRSLRLKPGAYKVRLLIFETVFPGRHAPTEVLSGLTVTDATAQGSVGDIKLDTHSLNYSFRSKKDRPCDIEFVDDFESGSAIRTLLSSPRFRKRFSKTKVLFSFGDINGMLTFDTIRRILSPVRIPVRRMLLMIRRRHMKKARRTVHVTLT